LFHAVGGIESIDALASHFPPDERFGLSSQLRRTAISLFPSTIVEGNGFGRTGRYVHHLPIARGLKAELETQLELAKQRGFIEPPRIEPLLIESGEIGRILNELISSLERRTD